MLRLATKYEAQALRAAAIRTLTTAYPSTSAGWHQRDTFRLFPPIENEIPTLLALSLEHDVSSVVPTLLFAACRAQNPGEVISEFLASPLSLDVIQDACRRFVEGRDRLRQAEIKYILAFLDRSFLRPYCQNYNSDAARIQMYVPHTLLRLATSSPYEDWCIDTDLHVSSLGLCGNCEQAIKKSIREGEARIWRELPQIFGYSSWEILQTKAAL